MRKKFILLMCIILVGGIIGGCSEQKQVAGNSPQELVIGMAADVQGFHPYGYTPGVWDVFSCIYETLVTVDEKMEVRPQLAESWELSADGLSWTFHLRKGVKFCDGSPFTAEAVKFALTYLKEQSGYPTPLLKEIKSMDIIDDHTIRFTCKEPYAPLLADLTDIRYPIIGPTSIDESGKFKKPVGTGPFMVKDWVKDQKIELIRNDQYWRGRPKLDKVIFKIIPDPQTRSMALEAGEINFVNGGLLVPEIERLKGNPRFTINRVAEGKICRQFIAFNAKAGPFRDLKARQAVSYGIDVQEIIQSMLGDLGKPAAGPVAPPSPYLHPNLQGYKYDPAKAIKLLAEAGWKDGDGDGFLEKGENPFQVSLVLTNPEEKVIAQIVQAQLKKIGIDVKLQVLEHAARTKALTGGKFDLMMLTGMYASGADPHLHFKFLYRTGQGYDYLYKSERLDDLLNRLDGITDAKERLDVYKEVQEELVNNAAAVFLYNQDHVVVMHKAVMGFEPVPLAWNLNSLWKTELVR